METTLWRRHKPTCPHQAKGRNYLKCTCMLWGDGYRNGIREFRVSLKTRDLARARKRLGDLEGSEVQASKSISGAILAFKAHGLSIGHADATRKRYNIRLRKLAVFCELHHLRTVRHLTTERLDEFRGTRITPAGKPLAAITLAKELETLRTFLDFCRDRRWCEDNAAKCIRNPRGLKSAEVCVYTSSEVERIIAAAETFGRGPYERLRATALLKLMRYTALRVGDAAMFERDRLEKSDGRWRLRVRTEKSGKAVYLPAPLDLVNALALAPVPRGSQPGCRYYFWNGTQPPERLKEKIARSLRSVFARSGVADAHSHRFRHTLATEMLSKGATFEDVADVLGNSPAVARKHYAKWSPARQERIDTLMDRIHSGATYLDAETLRIVQ